MFQRHYRKVENIDGLFHPKNNFYNREQLLR